MSEIKGQIEELISHYDESDRAVKLAVRSAITKTLRKIVPFLAKEIAREAQVPEQFIRQRMHIIRPKLKNLWGGLSTLVWDLPYYILGATQTKDGVQAAEHRLKGAFIATMNSGHTGVYKRQGLSRLPISEQKVDIKAPYIKVIARHMNRIEQAFYDRLESELTNV